MTICVVVVLTILSAWLIFLAVRQHQMMEQRVRFFVLVTAAERSLGELHEVSEGRAGRNEDVARLAAQAESDLWTLIQESDLFDTIQPQIVDQLTRVRRSLASTSSLEAPGGNVVTTEAFVRMHKVEDMARQFYTDRMRRHGILMGALSLLLASACVLLLFLTIISRRSERLIHSLDRDLRSLVESAPIVMLTVSRRGMVLRWNERLARLTATHAPRPLTDLFSQEHWPALETALEHARARGESECDLPLLMTDGSPVEIAWSFYARGAEITMAGRDISDRVAAQRELDRTSARYTQLFEQIRDAALITENGAVLDINTAGLALFGAPREMIIGKPLRDLVADAADISPFMHALLRHGFVIDYELRLVAFDGRVLDCLITAAARFDASGTLIGCQGLARDVTERKRMLEALRESEREYRGIFEHAYDPILVLDPVTEEVLDANDQACIMYDLPRNELVGRSMETLSVDPSRGKRMLRKMHEETGRYSAMESQQYRRDGTIMDVEINAAEAWFGGRKAILSINRDVTRRRAADRAMRESEERFRLLLESVTDYAIFMLDREGRVVSWNEGAQRITGYSAEEILGRETSIFFHPEDVPAAAAELAVAAAEGRAEVEGWRVRKDGSRFLGAVTVTRIVDENGALRGFAKITRDITELKRYESTQREIFNTVANVAAEWRQTFDAVQVPIVLLDGKGEIRRLNRAAQRLAKLPFQDLLYRPVGDLPGEPWQTVSRLARYANDFGRSAESRATDPEIGSVWQVSSSVTDLDSTERLVTVVVYDLTLVTSLEESLRQTEIAATLGAIVGGVAHEVRNPLFTISATLDAWEARLGETPHLRRYIVPLREEVDRLNRLMRDLLEYGKPPALALHAAPIGNPIAAAVCECFVPASARGIRIVTSIDDGLPDARIDSGRMEQVFQNVIANAVQLSPDGSEVRVAATSCGEEIVCTVTDEGPGLQPEEYERVFAPFYSRRKGGIGLGLSITRKIVAAHHGEIAIANREDAGGAVVTIVIPAARSMASTGDRENSNDAARRCERSAAG